MKGYFRKRGSKWSFTIDIGRDPVTGKRKQKTISGFRTKKEAEAACQALLYELNNGMYINEKDWTVRQLMEYYIDVHVSKLRPRTIDNYTKYIQNYIYPTLGDIKVKDLTTIKVQKWMAELNEKGYSLSTQKTVYLLLKGALKKAVSWEIVKKNCMENIPCPNPKRIERMTWSVEQVHSFLDASRQRNLNYYIAFLLAFHTGMRKSEILGLQWKDIDFDKKVIHVRRSLLDKKGGGYDFDDVKSGSSRRTIAIDDILLIELKKHRIRQREYRLVHGENYVDMDLVVSTYKGTPINQRTISEELYIIRERLGLPKIRFHDIRHTHATLLLQHGENVKVISERLGHSSIGITLDVYSHVVPDMQREAAERIARVLGK